MSDTIWVRRKSLAGNADAGDDFDHTLFCRSADQLDALATSLGVRKLSEFFDTTDLQYNMSDDDLPEEWVAENEKWFQPADALPAMRKIVERLKAGEVKGIKEKALPELLEELEDCLAKVAAAEAEKDQFHFCIVM